MRERRVIVIGAGMGGLAAALELAARGVAVTVLEKEPEVGGKVRRQEVGGAVVDAGPTTLTMRPVLDALVGAAGLRLEDLVTLRPVELLARHSWQDGSRLDLYADPDRTEDAIGAFAGPEDARGYRRFRAHARRIRESVEAPVLTAQRPTLAAMPGRMGLAAGLRTLFSIDARRTVWQALREFFADPRLCQLFARQAGLSGSSPLHAPATLNLIADVEGEAWTVDGGMWQLTRALADAVGRLGGEVRCGEGVAEILVRGRAAGVVTDHGEKILGDAVVLNADIGALRAGRFGAAARDAVTRAEGGERSLSAVTWTTVARTAGFPLAERNVFFSRDPAEELGALFDERRAPADPTVMVSAQGRVGLDGPERLLIQVAAPAETDGADQEHAMLRALARHGLELHREATVTTTPPDFERLSPGTGGALYGAVAHSWRATFDRAPAWSRLPGLYLAGGSVHPGAGVALAAMSGRLCAARVIEDLAVGRRLAAGERVGR